MRFFRDARRSINEREEKITRERSPGSQFWYLIDCTQRATYRDCSMAMNPLIKCVKLGVRNMGGETMWQNSWHATRRSSNRLE